MKKKNLIVIILTAVIFLSAVVLGVTTVYRVDDVQLNVEVYSQEATAEAEDLQEKLSALYKDESILFARKSAAEELFEDYPYFRITDFKKEFPNKIIVEAKEDVEVYAVKSGEDYYILSLDGTILGVRDSAKNRSDGNDNVLIQGLTVSGKKGEKVSGDAWNALLKVGQTISEKLDGVRSNFVEIAVANPTSSTEEIIFKIKTRETVNLYIRNPYESTEKKADALVEYYKNLEDEERLCGMVVAYDASGEVSVSYFNSDSLETYFNK